ncbi:MAG: sigma-70 family RNA polymerase sigma factor [Gemmataceae bacterium]
MTTQARAAIDQVIRSASRAAHAALSDRDLLCRYATDGDEAAFAALVQRHTGMVLGVCRRVLPTVPDAEDACQAVFLVLARKAATTRWQPSVANWLYLTARRVADRARRSAARRRRHEGQAAVPAATSPADALTARELLAALDEELARLPTMYRKPLVLCYLEGLTRDEAATRLGIPAGTVKIRLERGRKRLGDALTKRGVVGGVGVLALAATSPAGASPPRLIEAVLAAAAGDVPPAVAALAGGTVANKPLWVAAVLTVVATVGVGVGVVRSPTGQPPERKSPAKEAPAAPAKPQGIVAGRVLDPNGQPVAGATLAFLGVDFAPIPAGRTDADGRFTVVVPPPWRGTPITLIARADGFGADIAGASVADPAKPVELRLVKDCPVRGRLIDTQGKPVAGVSVHVADVQFLAGPSLDEYLVAWSKREFGVPPREPRNLFRFHHARASPWAATTDADGRFALAGIGIDRPARLAFSGAGIAEMEVVAVPRPGFDARPYTAAAVRVTDDAYGPGPSFCGPDVALVTEPEKVIRGTVTEADTGRPRANVTVSVGGHGRRQNSLTARTDAAGRFEVRGLRKAQGYTVRVQADAAAGLLGRMIDVADTPGFGSIQADIACPRGVIVTGRLIDGGTGGGVKGQVSLGVPAGNAFVKTREDANHLYGHAPALTEADGTFRLVAVPGPVILMGGPFGQGTHYKRVLTDPLYPQFFTSGPNAPPNQYFAAGGGTSPVQGVHCKVVVLEPGTKVATHDLVLEPARATTVKVQDADGKPLVGVYAAPATARDDEVTGPCRTDVCSVYEVSPDKPRLVAFYEPTRKLAGTLVVRGDEAEPPAVKLRPTATVTGRLLYPDGKPVAGLKVRIFYSENAAYRLQYRVQGDFAVNVPTDADGKFRIVNVFPGLSFGVYRHVEKTAFTAAAKGKTFTAEPGETKHVGNFTVPLPAEK